MMREVETETRQLASANGIAPPHVRLLFTNPDGFDIRRYNVPSSNEVCAVLTLNADQSIPANEMVVHQRGKEIVTLKNTDKRTEPFTYPLFYPKGTFGYSVDLKLQQPYPSRQHLTRLEMAQYRIAYRKGLTKNLPLEKDRSDLDLRETQFNALHFGGRLFQQYLVDTFIRVERDRIQWIKSNQKKILAEKYIGVSNFLKELAEKKDAVVSETIILPSSFPGSTRYYAEQFEDAMAIVRRFGSPDFFITMTCNPEWPEIKEAARIVTEEGFVIQQRAQDRPDLVARVAKLKFETIIEELYKKQIFGKVAAYVYTIEFQKRGLPHMHLLLIMRSEDKVHNPDELDDLISAEIPDNTDPELRELVLKWMIHNPCGEHDLYASCMKNHNGKIHCRFDFPKPFQETTSLVDDEKPKLRRRYDSRLDQQSPEFSHELAVYRKDKSGRRITRDNRHVAPYNAYLLKLFNCHINVEFVGSIRAVKYLYKYIYKGHDCAYIKIVEEQKRINYNEPDTYIEGRCITPPEACWRLSGNELQKKSHVVQRLDIHLPGHYRMSDIVNVQEDLADTGIKGSTLESYFKTNATKKQKEEANRLAGKDEEIIYHFYWQMPEHFKWIGRQSEWVERLRQINVIGRIHSVNFVAQPELYHLRMLLYHVNDATSFDELLKFNGIRHATFKQACLARGLAYDDQQWIDGLQESAMSKTPRAMRTLFTQILIFGSPENPKRLWEMFKADLAEDFLLEIGHTGGRVEDAINHTYRIIASKLNTEATEGRDFQYWVNTFGMDNIDFVNNHLNVDMLNNDSSILEGERLYGLLRGKQLDIVNTILDAVTSHNSGPRCFFIDGPGGTGKTFVYKTIYHILRGRNFNVKCMAFTGIASILLPNGRTSHKTFGLSVPLTPESVSNIKLGSMKAAQLAEVDVFLMDEAPMLPKYGLSTIDQLLRAIGNAKEPFGGKTIVLGGDFRQCLPIQPRANRSELLDVSLKKSDLWRHFKISRLTRNMRVDEEETDFAEFLLRIGDGEVPLNDMGEIALPQDVISKTNIIDEVYGDCLADKSYENMKDRAILAPLNKDVNLINCELIDRLPGEEKVYFSFDSIKDMSEGTLQFTTEFLNSIDIADLPPHKLKLKKNTIIMLLRNLDVSEGLCNGTRLIVTELCNNIIIAKILTGEHFGKAVHIPRITLDSSKGKLGCTMQRHQFPVTPAFAMTVHKSQGQTFQFVGVDLRVPVFMHGMLYVAFSRVKRQSCLKVLLPRDNANYTRNVVWKEVLN
ncbi:uncharacterized protein LOC129923663 [Biomphalaria glabrata]|uniref:ATP-dependent DNA helicase n=1 Tax=Biomphalaria glabrata TaxID=6526 RepID=A0A9W2Z9M3_BIOGL|nr:uncharacterized protein LOC129923663 [Biomphalaria glabrata]